METFYILENKVPVEASEKQWIDFLFQGKESHIGATVVGQTVVITQFAGLAELLFKTIAINGKGHMSQLGQYNTYEEAEAGHPIAVEKIIRELARETH